MTEQRDLQLVQALYAAFGRGDVPAILDHCSLPPGGLPPLEEPR